MDEEKRLRLYPTKDFKLPIDLLSQKIFDADFSSGNRLEFELLESRKRGITSKITILNGSGEQLTEFDRAVLNAALSEIANGNKTFTTAVIFRHLGGNRLTDNMRRAILDSFNRLSVVRVAVEAKEAHKKKIIDAPFDGEFNGYLLWNESVKATINGQELDAIHCGKTSISFFNADLHDQIISCPIELLQAPVKSTPRNIALNHYLLRRSLSIKGSNLLAESNKHVKPLCKVITFEDLYKHCGFDGDKKIDRQHARETTEKILKFLVENDVIKNFEFTKKDGKFYSIEIFL